MAHRRNRYIEASLKKIIGASPLIGLLGHRQVGKTTLLEKIAEAYYVLDLKSELELALNDPGNYVKTRAGHRVALDECQMAPPLFPALKEWVRIHKKPGQFLLSGSVRFTSRDAIRESLTGRIMNLELLPFSIPELLGEPLPHICFEALRANHFNHFLNAFPYQQSQCQKIHKEIPRYLEFGGLPSVCFLRDEKLRVQKINEQLQTILDRDIRLVKKILTAYSDIRRLTECLAMSQGEPLDFTNLKKQTGLATPTIKKIIYALEAVFMIRVFRIEGSTMGSVVFFEDQGEQRVLSDEKSLSIKNWIHLVFTNVRHQFEYRLGETYRMFQYRTRGGACVPICFSTPSGILGILPILKGEDYQQVRGSISSFLGTYGNAKLIIPTTELAPPVQVHPRALVAPMAYLIS